MTAREYLRQAYRLEQRIKLEKANIEELRELSTSVGSPGFEEHYNPNRSTDAPFVKVLERIAEMEEKSKKELALLLKLKDEMTEAINLLESQDERLVLKYRYLHNWTWGRIGDEIFADERTIRRWHDRALSHFTVPDNPTKI